MSRLAAALHRLEPVSGNSFTSPYPTYIEERPLYWQSRIFAQMQFLAELSEMEGGRYDGALLPAVQEAVDRYRINGYVTREDCLELEREILKVGIPAKDYRVICVGHAHMDMNWTWGYDETVQIVLDTLSTVLALMREYPDFKFSQSQASVYRIVEQYGPPSLLEELCRRIQEGRLEVTASTWVEADKNLPSMESQVRQILYAKRYLSRLLPIREEDLCIDFEPDTFGHPLHLPEWLSDAGIRYYYFNRGWAGPSISIWKSPSGAQILSYLDSAFYSAIVDHRLLVGKMSDCGASGQKTMLKLYGVGDHGGGPTRRDLDRLTDCMKWPLYPQMHFGTLREFYDILERDGTGIPVLCGERNPVYTGCYTSQSRIKSAARSAEQLLLQAECAGALNRLSGGEEYDRQTVNQGWENLLFQQFHDILTGSCVRESREYALGCLQQTKALANTVRQQALRSLASRTDTSCFSCVGKADPLLLGAGAGSGVKDGRPSQHVRQRDGGRVAFLWNPSSFERREMVEITIWDWSPHDVELLAIYDENGECVSHQILTKGFNYYWSHSFVRILVHAAVPAFGYRTLAVRDREELPLAGSVLAAGCQRLATPDEFVLENNMVRAEFSPRDGRLLSFKRLSDEYDYLDAARGGAGFRLIHEDTDKGMTAWIDGRWMSEEEPGPVHISRTASGPLRQAICIRTEIGRSSLEVEISLDADSTALTYTGTADWQERGISGESIPQLRFDVALKGKCKTFCYDVPMGLLAREEVNLDLPAGSFAVSKPEDNGSLMLWADSRHGFRGYDNRLGVTLVRSSYDPDSQPETGEIAFSFKLALADDTTASSLCRQAERYGNPIQAISDTSHPGALPPSGSLISLEAENAVIDSFKLAEDGDALILRMHETEGRSGTAVLSFGFPVRQAVLTDVLERKASEEILQKENQLMVPLSPYALRTLKISVGGMDK